MRSFTVILSVFLSSFTLFGEVNEATGDMVLNQNLFRISSGKEVFLDINLTYQSGIKINQRATWVGLGFDLSLPYVERIPSGSADEKTGENPDCLGSLIDRYSSIKHYGKLLLSEGNGYSATPATAFYTGQQDVFILNAPFAGGRIVFAQPSGPSERMKPYLQNWRAVKVDYNIVTNEETGNADISKWTFVDENGMTYLFEKAVRVGTVNGSKRAMASHNIIGRDGLWIPDGDNGRIIYGDGYANDFYNSRWYLTEIRSPIGDYVKIDYTSEQTPVTFFDASCFSGVNNGHAADDLFANSVPVTSVFRYKEGVTKYSAVSFAAPENVRKLYPVYPVRIYSKFESAEFHRSATDDIVLQGKARIDEIHLYSGSVLQKKIRFNYSTSTTGLALNHPYAGVGKSLLKLNSISTVSSSGSVLPIMSFEYAANPDIEYSTSGTLTNYTGMLYHDFFGYRSGASIMSLHPFGYPEGQSTLADAKAWSVNRITYGNGKIDEYEYGLNEITALSTNEVIATSANALKAGIRVTRRKEYTGIGSEAVISNYSYGTGYAPFNSAFDNFPVVSVQDFYTWLNSGDFATGIKNVLALDGATPQYSYCKRQTTGAGSVITYFLNPSSEVDNYNAPGTSLLMDFRNETKGINSRAPFRGSVVKIECFSQTDDVTPVSVVDYYYKLKLDFKLYETPVVTSVSMPTCVTCEDCDEENPLLDPNNLKQNEYIGYLRLMRMEEKKDGVVKSTENVAYNENNGLPSKTRITNSDGRRRLTWSIFAYEAWDAWGNPSYPGMEAANMLAQPCVNAVFEKPKDDPSIILSSQEEIRSSSTITWSKTIGCPMYVPKEIQLWNNDIMSQQINKTFKRYDSYGVPLEIQNAKGISSTTVYRNDMHLPIASIANANFKECGVFTGDYNTGENPLYWDYQNGWEKGTTNTVELVSDASNVHFGESVIHVVKDYAAGRNNLVIPGKAYKMTAWVKVTSNATGSGIRLATDFRYSSNLTQWPVVNPTSGGPSAIYTPLVTATECNGSWKLIQLDIPASVTSQLPPTMGGVPVAWYARAFVGNHPTEPTFNAYVDDVRFGPASKSFISTTYYDSKWQQSILSVDATNKPGKKVAYDDFGRPTEWWKIDVLNPLQPVLVEEKCYHLMNETSSSPFDPAKQYKIVSKVDESKCIDIAGTSAQWVSGQPVHMWAYGGGANQKWKIIPDGCGCYTIVSMHDQTLGIDDPEGNIANETALRVLTVSGPAQKWRIIPTEPAGYYKIASKGNVNVVIDVKDGQDGNVANGDIVHLFAGWNANNQKWKIVDVTP
jgi:hypothetical protein